MAIPVGYVQHSSGYWFRPSDQSGPYTFDGTTVALFGGNTPVGASTYYQGSGNVANAIATAGIGSGTNNSWLAGFDVTGAGAVAASIVQVTVTGLAIQGGSFVWHIVVPAGVTTSITPLSVRFNPPLKSNAGTNIVVSVAAFGTGNTNAALNVYGLST